MATIEITKAIPAVSPFYGTLTNVADNDIVVTGSDNWRVVTLKLEGTTEMSGSVKKNLLKFALAYTAKKSKDANTDNPTNNVLDLNRTETTMDLRVHLDDGPTYTAWQKLWMLRAMVVSGNIGDQGMPLQSLVVGDITFNSSTMQAFIESMTWQYQSQDAEPHVRHTSGSDSINGVSRFTVSLSICFGIDRFST